MTSCHRYYVGGEGERATFQELDKYLAEEIVHISFSPEILSFWGNEEEKDEKDVIETREGRGQPSLFPSFSPLLLGDVGFSTGHH